MSKMIGCLSRTTPDAVRVGDGELCLHGIRARQRAR
jgi:hypothetical protein